MNEVLIGIVVVGGGVFLWYCPIFKPYWGFWQEEPEDDPDETKPNGF